ncbi:hypothetical protein G7Y89_g3125 [Cudoniella acicularis]|uniref:DUF1763-domain-containing protein n=1 Tax=Cudoniella acicularis TaxID=354080 RepID=A0A8H4RTX1_9HELO|nr:hypothetical protein G7Y89_g3125 [Cudoniella acicularis]
MSGPSKLELIHAYRHLYRGLLKAVQYSKPARYMARDQLRKSFRNDDPTTFNQDKVDKTMEFLRGAAQERGLEHRILRNLLLSKWTPRVGNASTATHVRNTARLNYDMTLAMLNESMGLCLR